MRIVEAIEELNLSKNQLTDQMRIIARDTYPLSSWIKAAELWLTNLDRTHQVPGRVVYQITDICRTYHSGIRLTDKQQHFLAMTLIDNWHEMSCQARADLML